MMDDNDTKTQNSEINTINEDIDIFLQSNDGKSYKIKRSILKDSEVIESMISDIGIENTTIPLENITGEILEKIVFYLEYSNDIDNQENKTEYINTKQKELLDIEDDTMFNLILGSNYLGITKLLDICCKSVAEEIKKCKTPDEIRKRFNIKNDFTPEEEDDILRENEWLNN